MDFFVPGRIFCGYHCSFCDSIIGPQHHFIGGINDGRFIFLIRFIGVGVQSWQQGFYRAAGGWTFRGCMSFVSLSIELVCGKCIGVSKFLRPSVDFAPFWTYIQNLKKEKKRRNPSQPECHAQEVFWRIVEHPGSASAFFNIILSTILNMLNLFFFFLHLVSYVILFNL